jgi:hypothetical protein
MLNDHKVHLQKSHYSMVSHCQQMTSYYNTILSTTVQDNWKQIYQEELTCYKIYDV